MNRKEGMSGGRFITLILLTILGVHGPGGFALGDESDPGGWHPSPSPVPAPPAGLPEPIQNHAWLELGVGLITPSHFSPDIRDERYGYIEGGWQPLSLVDCDSGMARIFKLTGIVADGFFTSTLSEHRNDFTPHTALACDDHGNCRTVQVLTRDTYLKYIANSVSVGIYVPIEFAQFALEPNVRIRFLNVKEQREISSGFADYQWLFPHSSTWKQSTTVGAKVKFSLTKKAYFGVSGEYAVSGPITFTSYRMGVGWHFSGWK